MSFSTTTPPRLRFLVAGPLSPRPSGRREALALAELPERLKARPVQVKVDVGPALGAAGPLTITASFPRFRDFAAAEVAGQALGELSRLATRLGAATGRPRADEFLASVERIAGRGPLHAALARCFAPPERPAEPAGGDLVEELLTRGQQRSAAATAIDAVVRGVAASPAGIDGEAAKAAHACLTAALARAACAALADPAVRAAEVRHKALRLFLGQCPRDQAIEVELLDVPAGEVPPALVELAEAEPLQRPDLVIVLDAVDSLATARALAEAGADLHAPVLVELSPRAFGRASLAELAAAEGSPSAEWDELRARPESRWLAAVVNAPALAAEATAAGERVVCGGGALAVAGLLAGSFRDVGVFSRLGVEAELRAPATWHVQHVREDIALSLAEPCAATAQVALAGHGLCALGGPPGSDVLALVACPVVHASEEGATLAAQILAGRTVRFALWARALLPAGAGAAEAADWLTRAAALLLLPGTEVRPRFGAAIEGGAEGPVLRVAASFSAALAGTPVALSFALPLPR